MATPKWCKLHILDNEEELYIPVLGSETYQVKFESLPPTVQFALGKVTDKKNYLAVCEAFDKYVPFWDYFDFVFHVLQ